MNDQAVKKFMDIREKIHEHLKILIDACDNHFDVLPEDIDYGHVGTLNKVASDLKEIRQFLGI